MKAEIAPVLPSSNVVTNALGISATIPAKIINDIDGRKLPIKIKEEGLNSEYSGDNKLFMNEFKEMKFLKNQ